MIRLILTIALLLVHLGVGGCAVPSRSSRTGGAGVQETPQHFAARALRAIDEWGFRGVPVTKDIPKTEPWFAEEVVRTFRRVNVQREQYHATFPDVPGEPPQKPPWCLEGDIFTGNWEGMTNFSIGRTLHRRGKTAVEAHVRWTQGPAWTIYLLLDRAGARWVVADIEFADSDETMLEGIKECLERFDKKIAAARLKRHS